MSIIPELDRAKEAFAEVVSCIERLDWDGFDAAMVRLRAADDQFFARISEELGHVR